MTDSAQHATNANALLKRTTETIEKMTSAPSDVILGTASLITARAQVEATLSVAAAIREQTAMLSKLPVVHLAVRADPDPDAFDRRLS